MLCYDSMPQSPVRTLERTGWFQPNTNRGFKEENLLQVSGQLRKGESSINASTKVRAEDSALLPAFGTPRPKTLRKPAFTYPAAPGPRSSLTWTLFSKNLHFFKIVLTTKMLYVWYLMSWDDGDYTLHPFLHR